jgi:Tol biopolymer transport system component
MARIFISYSRADEAFARTLATSLAEWGADIWIDVEDIPVGLKWSRAIQEGLDLSDVLIVIISPDSMSSPNVEDEWQYFLDQHKLVIPVLHRPAKVHFQLSRVQYIDFNKHAYDLALRQLHAVLSQKGLALNPLPGHAAQPPAQKSLPVRQDSIPAGASIGRSRGLIVLGAVVGIAVIALLILSSLNPPNPLVADDTLTPTDTIENTRVVASETRAPTDTPTITLTPTLTPTTTPTLSATDIEGTVEAEIAAIPTQEMETQAAALTATATLWTPTSTFDARATARARVTKTFEALIAQATATFLAAQTQVALDQTATATLWTPTPSPTLTPSGGGARIVYSSRGGNNNEDIYTVDRNTLSVQQLTNDPANDLYASWSPDGGRIVFSSNRGGSNRDLYVMDADGGNLTRLTFTSDYEEDPAWSPDGTQIAYSLSVGVEGKRDIWLINADGTNARQLTINPPDDPREDRQPAWSPDGTRIAFHSDRKDAGYFQIYTLDSQCASPEDCERTMQAVNNAYGTFPDWSPDGQWLVFQTNSDGDWNIYLININGTGLRRLTDDQREDRRPAWSPDGTQVVFQSNRSGGFELYAVSAAGGETHRLTDNTWDDNDPDWQPG